MSDLTSRFEAAAARVLQVKSMVGSPHRAYHLFTHIHNSSKDNTKKLQLYGLFKQAKLGDCNVDRPGMYAPHLLTETFV